MARYRQMFDIDVALTFITDFPSFSYEYALKIIVKGGAGADSHSIGGGATAIAPPNSKTVPTLTLIFVFTGDGDWHVVLTRNNSARCSITLCYGKYPVLPLSQALFV